MRLPSRTIRWIAAALGLAVVAGAVFAAVPRLGPTGLSSLWPWGRRPAGFDPAAPIDPSRQYHLVVWDYKLPFDSPSGAAFEQASRDAIARFQARYPNVAVDLHMLDPGEGTARLAEALAAGYPPDVYCSLYGPAVIGSALQVPLGSYIDEEAYLEVNPVAWQTVKVNGTIWAEPRFMLLWPWLGNADLLAELGVDPAHLSADGWSRDEFARLAAEAALAAGPLGGIPTVTTSSPAVVFRDLLLPACLGQAVPQLTASSATAAFPGDFWLGAGPGALALWLSELQKGDALRAESSSTNPGSIDAFVHGRSLVLVNASPWATMYIMEYVKRPEPWQYDLPDRSGRPSMVLLPPPHGEGEPSVVMLTSSPILVFRQARYKGDDNTRLAAELALELRVGARAWLRDQVLCVPADISELAAWRLRCERFGEVGAFALRSFEDIEALAGTDAALERLNQAFTTLSYGPWAPALAGEAPAAGEASPPHALAKNTPSLATKGYLGPFLERVVAPAAEKFWNGGALPGDLINDLTEGALSEP